MVPIVSKIVDVRNIFTHFNGTGLEETVLIQGNRRCGVYVVLLPLAQGAEFAPVRVGFLVEINLSYSFCLKGKYLVILPQSIQCYHLGISLIQYYYKKIRI